LVDFDNTPVRGNNGRVTEEIFELEVVIKTYREIIRFNITETSIYNASFRLLWLKRYESDIAYKARIIQFGKYSYNSETSAVEIFPISLAAIAVYQRRDSNLVLFALMTIPAKELRAIEIPLKYRGFQHLFEEIKGKKALPKHRL
jgi:hypothetical protein